MSAQIDDPGGDQDSLCERLAQVRAQVMVRDDSMGGWLPVGGLSCVCVCRRAATVTPPGGDQYVIYGRRLQDNSMVLSCEIGGDFVYHKVMPTFHHWSTDRQRYGLTFLTASDGRAFDAAVRTAVQRIYSAVSDRDGDSCGSVAMSGGRTQSPCGSGADCVATNSPPIACATTGGLERTCSHSSHLHSVVFGGSVLTDDQEDQYSRYVCLSLEPPVVKKSLSSADTSVVLALAELSRADSHEYSYPCVMDSGADGGGSKSPPSSRSVRRSGSLWRRLADSLRRHCCTRRQEV